MSVELILTFVVASGLISLAPGPDNIFVLTQSALYGRKSGLFVIFGLCTGLVVHTFAVALGLAAIFQTSTIAFNILKYAGVAYLFYLAWRAFKASPVSLQSPGETVLSYKALYLRGIIMNVTNPKVSIFFLAFLPQFTSPESGSLIAQFFVLGTTFILVAAAIFIGIACLAGSLGSLITHSPKSQKYLNRIAAIVFIGLAAKLVASSTNT